MKFSALNLDFDDPSLDSRFKKTCALGHQRAVFSQSFVKTVADKHGHAAYCKKR